MEAIEQRANAADDDARVAQEKHCRA
ncbi:hypothetical protein L195_g044086, partial [Trifolium pratense]